ncbi:MULTISPECIES: DUF2235 domain-containing protein [unclassified Marinobacter]|uniref:phospholipase effector Tle1 domain-containing protein n=1 Tax=unclassified Marinobacter TaxID=83889 RepID=UPI0025796B1B|nr:MULTISPECIES: DUF2235 domain-containing protein [unclassified Marinobacter]
MLALAVKVLYVFVARGTNGQVPGDTKATGTVMQLKFHGDLTAQDLPLIESPFFAANKAMSILTAFYSHERERLRLPDSLSCQSRSLVNWADEICSRISAGEILLVYSRIERNELFSPLVSWNPDENGAGQGRWRYRNCGAHCAGIGNAVAAFNRYEITPADLDPAMGVGSLPATGFETELRIQQAQNRQRSEPAAQSFSGTLGTQANVASLSPAENPATGRDNHNVEEPPLEIVAGLFTDGTLNNVDNIQAFERRVESECLEPMRNDPSKRAECEERLRLTMGESYAGAPTNVAKLWRLYRDSSQDRIDGRPLILKVYSAGAGTRTGGDDSIIGMATGLGETGVLDQVKRLFSDLADQIAVVAGGQPRYRIIFDLFGFSRGAAAARHAANQILKGTDGELSKALQRSGIAWPEKVTIRFVGLFDTVAGIVNLASLDPSPGNDRSNPVELFLDSKKVNHALHLTAMHEKRANFSLSSLRNPDGSLPRNFREVSLPGAHSDVGGGYADREIEEVLLYPTVSIRGSDTKWPRQTMEWDTLGEMLGHYESEGWIGEFSLPLPDSADPELAIESQRLDHPVPDGQVLLSLKMRRYLLADYSRVALKIMYEEAIKAGVMMYELDESDVALNFPDELRPVFERVRDAVAAGNDSVGLDSSLSNLLLQKYTHHSDHYNLMSSLVSGETFQFEFPISRLHPFRPTLHRERTIHPNREPETKNDS